MSFMPRLIRKYANRRLYDTEASRYITLEDLKKLIVAGEDIQVQEAKGKQDVTREVLLQIVAEQEHLGSPILHEAILTSLIRFYGHPMQGMASQYLEGALQQLQKQRLQIAEQMQAVLQNPAEVLGTLAQQNLEWINRLQENFLRAVTPADRKSRKNQSPGSG